MQLELLIEKFTKEMELPGSLASEFPGIYAIPIDVGLSITVTSLDRFGVSLQCSFLPIPPAQNEDLFLQLLIGNLFGQGTKGATIGLNESKKMLTLQQDLPYDIDYEQFRDTIDDFINTVDFWREESHNYIKGS